MYGFNKKELEGLNSNNPCSKNVYFKQWKNRGRICLCFRIMLSGLTVPDGLFMSWEWKEMSVSSPKLEFPLLRHFWQENNEDAEMKATYRTFIRFHTRCTKNKPDRVSQEIAARKRGKRRNIWNLYSCCRNIQGGRGIIYLCIMCPERKGSQKGITVPQDHTHCFIPALCCRAQLSASPLQVLEKGTFYFSLSFLMKS